MAHSDPALRDDIVTRMQQTGPISARTLTELKQTLGVDPTVSNTSFGKALRSLCYNHGRVSISRPRNYDDHIQPGRQYHVALV